MCLSPTLPVILYTHNHLFMLKYTYFQSLALVLIIVLAAGTVARQCTSRSACGHVSVEGVLSEQDIDYCIMCCIHCTCLIICQITLYSFDVFQLDGTCGQSDAGVDLLSHLGAPTSGMMYGEGTTMALHSFSHMLRWPASSYARVSRPDNSAPCVSWWMGMHTSRKYICEDVVQWNVCVVGLNDAVLCFICFQECSVRPHAVERLRAGGIVPRLRVYYYPGSEHRCRTSKRPSSLSWSAPRAAGDSCTPDVLTYYVRMGGLVPLRNMMCVCSLQQVVTCDMIYTDFTLYTNMMIFFMYFQEHGAHSHALERLLAGGGSISTTWLLLS